MRAVPTALADVILVEPDVYRDDRGYFLETYHEPKYHAIGIDLQLGRLANVDLSFFHSTDMNDCLANLEPRVELSEDLMRRALLPLERMLAVR